MRDIQEQSVNRASLYKVLRPKVDKPVAKINSTKLQHQEDSEKITPSKSKGTTKKDICAEEYNKYGYPIIYCHIHEIINNLIYFSMKFKLPSDTHTK